MDGILKGTTAARRWGYLAAALLTIAVGLLVHRGPLPLNGALRDIIGDALWAVMMVCWVSALQPHAPRRVRLIASLVLCWLVELSQLLHTPALDAFRATTAGHLVLGSGFDPRDLLAYTVGVVIAARLDAWISTERG